MNARELAEYARTQRRIDMLEREIRSVPSRWARSTSATPFKYVHVLGGNSFAVGATTLTCIKYVSDGSFTNPLTVNYDPDVDTSYADGLGYGYLYIDGVKQTGNVLIRNNYASFQAPIIAGRRFKTGGTVLLPYDDGAGDTGNLTAYTIEFE